MIGENNMANWTVNTTHQQRDIRFEEMTSSIGLDQKEDDSWKDYVSTVPPSAAVLPTIIIILIFFSNIIILIAFSRMKKLKYHHYYLIALAVSDLILIPILSLTSYTMISGHVLMNSYICNMKGVLISSPLTTTICIHCCMCIDKAISVLKPHVYHNFVSKPKSKQWIVTAMVCIFILPVFYIGALFHTDILHFYFESSICTCVPQWTVRSYLAYGVASVLGLLVQVISHYLIFKKILSMPKTNGQRLMRATRTMLLTVGAYYICWLPYSILMLVQSFSSSIRAFKWAIYFLTNLLTVNSCVNVFIYCFTLPGFREQIFTSPRIGVREEQSAQNS